MIQPKIFRKTNLYQINFIIQYFHIAISQMGNYNPIESKILDDQKFVLQYALHQADVISGLAHFDSEKISFPLKTQGANIVDNQGHKVKLAGANWSGGHAQRHCVSGLQYRKLSDLCQQIRHKFDMNVIRLTFSLQMYYDNNIIDKQLIAANPDLFGKTSMQIFDRTVQQITRAGIMIILNNHTSRSQWCCSDNDGDGLWYVQGKQQYSQERFFKCLVDMAKRYKNNKLVIGMDLRNQLRKANNVKPTWGDYNKKTDWKLAATEAGNRVLAEAPHWLIFVSGLNYQLDLRPAYQSPIQLKVPNKLVYTGHIYNFSWPAYSWTIAKYQDFKEKMINQQLLIRAQKVPFLLGQFGNNQRDKYWTFLMKFLKEKNIDWTYWCLDGYKCKNKQDQTYGIWSYDYSKPRHPEMLRDIQQVGRPQKGIKITDN